MGCPNCLKRLVARMSPCLRLAPTVPAGSRGACKYDPLLLRGNVKFDPIMSVPDSTSTSTRDREGRTLLAIKNLRHVPQWEGCVAFLLL